MIFDLALNLVALIQQTIRAKKIKRKGIRKMLVVSQKGLVQWLMRMTFPAAETRSWVRYLFEIFEDTAEYFCF